MGSKTKGGASRGLLVFLRLGELTCGAIVLGIIGRLLDLVDEAGVSPNARLIYTVVVASLTIIFSLFFILPMAYSFWAFPIDFFMFAAWLTAFCLLETLTGTDTCTSWWYNDYWGYYWGRWYRVGPVGIDVNWSGCSAWRTALAFTFVAMFTYLLSFCLGLYWISTYGKVKETGKKLLKRGNRGDPGHVAEVGNGGVVADRGVTAESKGPVTPPQTAANNGVVNPLGSSPPNVVAAPPATQASTNGPTVTTEPV